MNLEEVAEKTGLTFNQIQRLEGEINGSEIVKKGGDGKIATILTLLDYYGKRVSLDALFNVNVPTADISINKGTEKEIVREKILTFFEDIKEIVKYLE
jgi:transcriptional regulator with XRE-family HTH domain